jgi:hypothetical protein
MLGTTLKRSWQCLLPLRWDVSGPVSGLFISASEKTRYVSYCYKSPDHGSTAVLDRWVQLEPTVLFADSAVFYNGRAHDSLEKLGQIIAELPSVEHVIVFRKFGNQEVDLPGQAQLYEDFLKSAEDIDRPLVFEQLEPDHPVYILFSSGTTGSKCQSSCDEIPLTNFI